MFQNYIKIVLRNILRRKGYTFINITGLALGIACCILMLMFVNYELSYDSYHENAKNIYRVERNINMADFKGQTPTTSHPYGPTLKKDFPEIKAAVRVYRRAIDVLDQNNQYNRGHFIFADANVFDVFTWPLIRGDRNTALAEPFSIVITEALAKRHFGERDPIGEMITLQLGEDCDYKISGVMKDIPDNSHFSFDAIVSYETFRALTGEETMTIWFNHFIYTYLLLQDNANPADLEAKLPEWMELYMGDRARELFGVSGKAYEYIRLVLKPVTDIHLYPNSDWEIQPNGSMETVYIFSAIAFLTLLIACINFMNLSTARSVDRAKEVGLRKVVGAKRSRLIMQFFGESILFSFLSLIIAMLLVELFIPAFNAISEKSLSINYLSQPIFVLGLIGLTLFVGIFAGCYPAFFLSAFKPAEILKGKFRSNKRGLFLRKGLVIIQFSISIVLIIGTLVIFNQLDFLQNKKLGFNKEHVVIIPIDDGELGLPQIKALRNEIRNHSSVVSVATANSIPGDARFNDTIYRVDKSETIVEDQLDLRRFGGVSYDLLPTLGVKLVAGRNFSREFSTDSSAGYIINESAVKRIGWKSPEAAIGKRLARLNGMNPLRYREGKVVGVVKDFHYKSLHREIEPLVLELDLNRHRHVVVRITPENIPETLAFLKEKMAKISPRYPFKYFFQDEYFDRLYLSETRQMEIFGYFTFLTIFIACLGLFGLASYTTEQRRKEIGIRKVLGASILKIVINLSGEFTKWVLIANLIAWPLAWLFMDRWLRDFAYRVDLAIYVFLLAGLLALVIALLTVGLESLKAASRSPVKTLRYE